MMKKSLTVLAGAALVLVSPAAAETVYMGSGAAAATVANQFAAAFTPASVQDFEGFADGTLAPSWATGTGGTATLTNGFGVTSAYPYGGGATSGSNGYGAYPNGGIGGSPFFTFSAPVKSFGAYFVDFEVPNFLVVTYVGGGTFAFGLPFGGNGNVSFVGVNAGSAKISSIGFVLDPEDAFLIDDVQLAGAVPEPGNWALLLAGFGLVGGMVRRRRAISTTA